MRIKAKNANIASMKLIVPIDGIIVIDGNGETEVSDACADILVNRTNDWQYADKSSKSVNGKEDEENGKVGTNREKSDRDLLVEKVSSSKTNELKEMCAEAEFPESEWKNLNKVSLIKYILKKYDEADEED